MPASWPARSPHRSPSLLRTDDGFLIGELHGSEVLIDDFAVTGDDRWPADGAGLLASACGQAATAGAHTARVVTAAADAPKVALLVSAGLAPVSRWWVKPVKPVRPVTPAGLPARAGRVQGTGFTGHLGPAPPVYDPGGPVLLLDELPGGASVAAVEAAAAAMGAVLAVVPATPGAAGEQHLTQRGWTVASQWHLGAAAQPPRPGSLAE